jgi:hypothetical protein
MIWESGDDIERAKSRHFRPILAFLGELGRTPSLAGWRRSTDRTCLQTNSLLTGNLTGKFKVLGVKSGMLPQKRTVLQALGRHFPGLVNRENYSRIRELSQVNRDFGYHSSIRCSRLRPTPSDRLRTKAGHLPRRLSPILSKKVAASAGTLFEA